MLKKVICNLCSNEFLSGGSERKFLVLLLSHFILFFFIICFCKVSLFSLNNGIQSIALVFRHKKVLLDLFNFFYRSAIIL